MKDIVVGKSLPEDFIGTTPEGLSGSFSGSLMFILKMEDLTSDDIEIFNRASMSLDLLELNDYKDKIGSLYAFSILVENFIDNSEVLVDFRVEDIENILAKKFEEGKGIDVAFILADEEDMVLAIREFKLDAKLSEVVSQKAYEQNTFVCEANDSNTDYVILAFQKLFENEPEENVHKFSIGRSEIW
ncbi:MAG: hypothetical protein ACRCWM_00835 [Sarcina sp.]